MSSIILWGNNDEGAVTYAGRTLLMSVEQIMMDGRYVDGIIHLMVRLTILKFCVLEILP